MDFDPKSITPENKKAVLKVMKQKANSFEHDVIYRASAACGSFADWLQACLSYADVFENVIPLNEKLKKLDKNLDASRKRLGECAE